MGVFDNGKSEYELSFVEFVMYVSKTRTGLKMYVEFVNFSGT